MFVSEVGFVGMVNVTWQILWDLMDVHIDFPSRGRVEVGQYLFFSAVLKMGEIYIICNVTSSQATCRHDVAPVFTQTTLHPCWCSQCQGWRNAGAGRRWSGSHQDHPDGAASVPLACTVSAVRTRLCSTPLTCVNQISRRPLIWKLEAFSEYCANFRDISMTAIFSSGLAHLVQGDESFPAGWRWWWGRPSGPGGAGPGPPSSSL